MLTLVKGLGPFTPWLVPESVVANNNILETDPTWCWSFWPLSLPTGQRRLFGAYSTTYRGREAFYGHLCWSAGSFPGLRGG